MIFLYLHGYDGSPVGRKATELRRLLASAPVLATAYSPDDPDRALPHLERFIAEARTSHAGEPCVLVGSSLGGLSARHLAHRLRLPCVLFNPVESRKGPFVQKSIAPSVGRMSLQQPLGQGIVRNSGHAER